MLCQLGAVTFDVEPVNLHEISERTGADYAAKDIVGAAKPREFSGEADEKITLHGKVFPQEFGGLTELEVLKALSKSGQPQILVGGDGYNYGWFFIEFADRKSSFLNAVGVGRVIEFEVSLVRSPKAASALGMISTLINLLRVL